MRTILFILLTLLSGSAIADKTIEYHNCSKVSETSNVEGYQTTSETYKCDEGYIELKGCWSMTIEKDYVYDTKLGRIEGDPKPVYKPLIQLFKWCPTPTKQDPNQKELCGLIPPKECYDGRPPRFNKSGDWNCQ